MTTEPLKELCQMTYTHTYIHCSLPLSRWAPILRILRAFSSVYYLFSVWTVFRVVLFWVLCTFQATRKLNTLTWWVLSGSETALLSFKEEFNSLWNVYILQIHFLDICRSVLSLDIFLTFIFISVYVVSYTPIWKLSLSSKPSLTLDCAVKGHSPVNC